MTVLVTLRVCILTTRRRLTLTGEPARESRPKARKFHSKRLRRSRHADPDVGARGARGAAVGLGDRVHDGEAETGAAARSALVEAAEALERTWHELGREAGAPVAG